MPFELINNRHTDVSGEPCSVCNACDCEDVGNECTREHPFMTQDDYCVGLDFYYRDTETDRYLCPACVPRRVQLELFDLR